MYYQDLFNQNYINESQYKELLLKKAQIEQMIKFETEQQMQIERMAKALNDFCDAAEKIAPQYQNQANTRCIWELCKRLYKNNN